MDTKKMMLTFLTPEGERAATEFSINERIKKAGLTIKMYMERWGGDRRELEREWLNCCWNLGGRILTTRDTAVVPHCS